MTNIDAKHPSSARSSGKSLLVVDDEPAIRKMLATYLRRLGHECAEAGTGAEALEMMQAVRYDALLSDIRMPQMNGIELLKRVKAHQENVAVVMISANHEIRDAIAAMKLGADDYILKPFEFDQVSVALERALERRELQLKVQEYQKNLESMVIKRTNQIHRLFVGVIQSMINILEARDTYTIGHSKRVAWMALLLGRAVGVSRRDLEIVQLGGAFHDLGKIGIREDVLAKEGALTPEEYIHIKTHPDIGYRILEPLKEFKDMLAIVRHHHEHYDGSGYPSGLCGEEIPLTCRIVSVADAFDAMTSTRPYREAQSAGDAIVNLKDKAGSMLDPQLVEMFVPVAQQQWFRDVIYSQLLVPQGTAQPGLDLPNCQEIVDPLALNQLGALCTDYEDTPDDSEDQ